MAAAICVPRSPANLRAYGSRKTASARSLSCARYTATHRAVSEMWRIGFAELMARESYLFSGDEACAQWQLLITGHCTHHPHPTPAPVKVAIRARRAVRPILRHRRPSAMRRKKCKLSYRRTVLRLPDLDHSKLAVLNSLTSPASRRVYQYAIDQFTAWYCSEPRLAFNRIVVVRYRMHLESRGLAANTINQQLAAVRRLAHEAAEAGLLSPELAAGISRVKGVKQLGFRSGNWLTVEQCSQVLGLAAGPSLRAKRDSAMLAMLFGCGLRRSELVGLQLDEVQMRQGHWAIVDLIGKGGHIRTVPIPAWVKAALDEWIAEAGITRGRIFRAVGRAGKVWGNGVSQNVVWYVVKTCCERAGLQHIAPHDLRRTCAKLCHRSGGELEQIQFLLGHASVQTTERYLGCKQNLGHPVNDLFDLGADPRTKQVP